MFKDACEVTELKWRAEEVRQRENRAKHNKKKTYRRSALDIPSHHYQTRYATNVAATRIAEGEIDVATIAE